jgi:YD repeat-containing protein
VGEPSLQLRHAHRLARRRDFTYDELNRLTKEEWVTSGSTVNTLTFTYDGNSNLLTAQDADGRITFTYDAVNRRDTQKDVWALTLTFTYDAVGNRTKVQDSLSGVTTSTYNAVNLLSKREFGGSGLTPLRADLTYTDRNQLATVSRYSDLAGSTLVGSTTFTYDASKRLTNLQHRNGGGSLLANFTYTYDLGNRLENEVTNGTTKTFTYDATNQLTNDGTATYTYDLNGNRTMTGYTTDTGNRLTNDGVYTYTYDDEGNLTRKSKGTSAETWDYTYDHWNHLLTAEKRDAVGGTLQMVATYVYDALGNRIEKRVDADGAGAGGVTTTRFALDMAHPGGLPDVWADLDGSSSLTM